MKALVKIAYLMAIGVAAATLAIAPAVTVSAEVPDTNSYWNYLAAMEKVARRQLDGAMQLCRGRSGADAEAAIKEWTETVQPGKYPGSDFNPCSGSGTLVTGKFTVAAANGRAAKLTESGALHTEWNFAARTVSLWFGGDHISLAVSPIAVSVLKASLWSADVRPQAGAPKDGISESMIASGLEAFWRSAREHYPNHSMYDVALQVITGKDEGREMLLDFIRCGKSICE